MAFIGWYTIRNLLQNLPLALVLVKKERARWTSVPRSPRLPIFIQSMLRVNAFAMLVGKRASTQAWAPFHQPCLQPKGWILADQFCKARENMPFSNSDPRLRVYLSGYTAVLNSMHLVNENGKEIDLRSDICIWWIQRNLWKMLLPPTYVWHRSMRWASVEAGTTVAIFP